MLNSLTCSIQNQIAFSVILLSQNQISVFEIFLLIFQRFQSLFYPQGFPLVLFSNPEIKTIEMRKQCNNLTPMNQHRRLACVINGSTVISSSSAQTCESASHVKSDKPSWKRKIKIIPSWRKRNHQIPSRADLLLLTQVCWVSSNKTTDRKKGRKNGY